MRVFVVPGGGDICIRRPYESNVVCVGGNDFVCWLYAICEFEYKFEWVACNWTFETDHDQNCIIETNEAQTFFLLFVSRLLLLSFRIATMV